MTASLFSLDLIHKLSVALLLAVLLCTLISLAGNYLYLELATHFRLQYLVASAVCLCLLTAFQSWRLVPIAVLCLFMNLLPILPYYRQTPDAPSSNGIKFKLLLANVLYSNRDYESFLNRIKKTNPDVMVVQEFTEEWKAHTADLTKDYPFVLLEPRDSGSGMAIFSRHSFHKSDRLKLDESTHVALLVQVNFDDTPFTILAMHPTTPINPWKFKNRNRQFAEAASIIQATKGPRLLVGDLNCTMWSPYFRKLVRDSGLRDARLGFGLHTTWPLPLPGFLRLPIDHCLVSEDLLVQGVSTGPNTGSDHRAILFELAIR